MSKINKNRLLNLIGEGKIEEAIGETLKVTAKVDEDIHALVMTQKSHYTHLERVSLTLSSDEVFQQRNKIALALSDIINDLPDEYPAKPKQSSVGTLIGGGTITSANNSGSGSSAQSQPLGATNYVLLFLLLLFMLVGMYAFFSFTGDKLEDTELYLILVVLGLIVGVGTHGVMNSRSTIESKTIRLGGPIVACLLTVVGGYFFINNNITSDKPETEITTPSNPSKKEDNKTTKETSKTEMPTPKSSSSKKTVSNPVYGCTNPKATNYNSKATEDDGSCKFARKSDIVYGCMNPKALNYNSKATKDDGSCEFAKKPAPIYGCTNPTATNYNVQATIDDGSCTYSRTTVISGCTNQNAINYNPNATRDDGSCRLDLCKNITCINGGICNKGKCECPDGYTGINCQTRKIINIFKVSEATLEASPRNSQGQCPKKITFSGRISTIGGSGTVSYRFIRNDGAEGPVQSLKFDSPGSKTVSTTWQLGDAGKSYDNWEAIKILEPNEMKSNKAFFSLECEKEERGFRVIEATLRADPRNSQGQCPKKITFSGRISTIGGSGTVSYRFIRNDGAKGPVQSLKFDSPGSKTVSTTWQLGGAGKSYDNYWEAIKILEPKEMESNKAYFSLKCQ